LKRNQVGEDEVLVCDGAESRSLDLFFYQSPLEDVAGFPADYRIDHRDAAQGAKVPRHLKIYNFIMKSYLILNKIKGWGTSSLGIRWGLAV